MFNAIMIDDQALSDLSESLDKFSDLVHVCNNIKEVKYNNRKVIEKVIRYRIFELQMLLNLVI